jgi:type VI secretion system protein VasI
MHCEKGVDMKLATMALIAMTTVITTLAVADNWLVQEETSRLDDSTNVFLWTESLEPISDRFSGLITPTLLIRCEENTTSIVIAWKTYLGIGESQITYRIDRLPAETHTWSLSTNFEAIGLWNGSSAIPFINRLFDKETLLARITPYGDSPVTAVFAIGGLKAAAAPLMQACHWKPRAAVGIQAAPKPEPERPPEPPEEDQFAALLRSVDQMERREQASTERDGTGRALAEVAGQARSRIGQGQITQSERDALYRQITRNWILPAGAQDLEEVVVELRIQVGPDRTVREIAIQDQARFERDPTFRAVAQSAYRAVERSSPLQLPPHKYHLWRDLVLNFRPQDAIGG